MSTMRESSPRRNTIPIHWPKLERLGRALRRIAEQGLAPKPLALAVAIGAAIGVLPTVWGTSVICFFLAWCLRLNHVVVQTTNYLVYPVQITLFLPFSSCGKSLFPFWFNQTSSLSLDVLKSSWSQLDNAIITTQLSALLGWALTAPIFATIIYLSIFRFCQYRDKQTSNPATN